MTEIELATLRAAMDRVFPRDDQPGATDLGADRFLVRLLETEPQFQPVYAQGLGSLIAAKFTEQDLAEQDRLLELTDRAFTQTLIQHTLEGVFADPGNGGNANGAAWDMIGFRVTA